MILVMIVIIIITIIIIMIMIIIIIIIIMIIMIIIIIIIIIYSNAGLLYGIFSSGACDCSTRRIQRIVQVGKKILKQFRSGDENCSTNANKQMRGRPRQNLQICF